MSQKLLEVSRGFVFNEGGDIAGARNKVAQRGNHIGTLCVAGVRGNHGQDAHATFFLIVGCFGRRLFVFN